MDLRDIQDIEQLIVRSLLHYRRLHFDGVCNLSLRREPSSLISAGTILIPSYDVLEVCVGDLEGSVSVVDLISSNYTSNNHQEAERLYTTFMNYAMPDGVTLTVQGLAVVNVSTCHVLALSEHLQNCLNPSSEIYLNPVQQEQGQGQEQEQGCFPTTSEPIISPVVPQRQSQRQYEGASLKTGTALFWISTVLFAGAVLYLSYYFLVR